MYSAAAASASPRSARSRTSKPLRAFLPERDPLARRLKPVERLDRGFPTPGRVGELLLGGVPLGEQCLQLLLRAAPREPGGGLALLRRLAPRVGGREVELGNPGAQADDLLGELLCALRRRRLQRERPKPLPHLGLDIAGPFDLNRDPVQLQLGPVPATLELPEAGRLLHELASFVGLGGEHCFDLALAHDRVHRAAETDVREQLDEVGATDLSLVDEVLAFAAAV